MKPRFSILALLGVTAYVAVLFAGFLQPVWITVSQWMIYVVNAAFIIVAAGKASSSSVFARGMILAIGVFAGQIYSGTPLAQMLTPVFFYIEHYYPRGSEEQAHLYGVIAWQFYFVIGAAVGCLALWRYRVLERRQNTPR